MNKLRAFSTFLRVAFVGVLVVGSTGRVSSAKAFQAAPTIVVPNLMAYWAADGDTGGMATDHSGNGNTGTLSGGGGGATVTSASPGVPAGNLVSYLFSQPSNQFISVADSPSLSITGSLTLAAWVRRTADNATLQKGIIEKYDESPLGAGYSLRIGMNEHYGFTVYSGITGKGITTAGTSLPFRGSDLNTWNHVAGVYDSANSPNMLIYKNGNPDATTSANTGQEPVAPPTDGTNVLQIGKDYGTNAFNGNIDEVRIYNRALTQDEVGILNTMVQPPATAFMATGGNSQNIMTWTAAANASPTVTVRYTVLRGTTSGVYTVAFNNIIGTTYTDTTAVPGTPYIYQVVAVSVIPSAGSVEQSATATNTPPPPPPPPRTTKSPDHGRCGVSTIPAPGFYPGTAVAGVLASLLLMTARRPRRNR